MNKSYYYEVVEHLNEEDNFEVMSAHLITVDNPEFNLV